MENDPPTLLTSEFDSWQWVFKFTADFDGVERQGIMPVQDLVRSVGRQLGREGYTQEFRNAVAAGAVDLGAYCTHENDPTDRSAATPH